MNYPKTILWSGVIAAFCLTGAAYAQDTSVDKDATRAKKADVAKTDEAPSLSFDDLLAFNDAGPQQNGNQNDQAQQLGTIQVTGILGSQIRSIQHKRFSPQIQDTISAEQIGRLPDTTITDSLQRVPGVQIDRSAGEGTSINIRGLPQVQITLNGEAFLPAANIVSNQPNFVAIPASLMAGVDVIKSPTASDLISGISGTVNLRTRHPFDLAPGSTFSATAAASQGEVVNDTQPKLSALYSYNGGSWGFLAAVAGSDLTHMNNQVTGRTVGGPSGYIVERAVLNPGGTFAEKHTNNISLIPPSDYPPKVNGHWDLDSNGKADGAFVSSERLQAWRNRIERKRLGANASFQADFGSGLSLTVDGFFTRLETWNRQVGAEITPAGWQIKTVLYPDARSTGVTLADHHGATLYITPKNRRYYGDIPSYMAVGYTHSISRNVSATLNFDNGGAFTGDVRFITASADSTLINSYMEMSISNGQSWPTPLKSGGFLQPSTTWLFPDGARPFNSLGVAPYQHSVLVDYSGYPTITPDAFTANVLNNPKAYAFKTASSEGNYDRAGGMNIARFDGDYTFDNGAKLEFGLRNSVRTAGNVGFLLAAPVYGDQGRFQGYASDPEGCWVHYKAGDIKLNNPVCTAGNSTGYFVANPWAGMNPSQLPDVIASNWKHYTNIAGTGLDIYGVDPSSIDDPRALQEALYPGEKRNVNPGASWDVRLHEIRSYVQADFDGEFNGMRASANVGVRLVNTTLNVTQFVSQGNVPYNLYAPAAGYVPTERSYTDILPAINAALLVTPKFKIRAAASKNMIPLSLNQWGGGVTYNYSLDSNPNSPSFGVQRVTGGNSTGNPDLEPWRSTNYGLSLEYYINDKSMISLAAFRIDVASFVQSGIVSRCNVPDADNVVRGCINVNTNVQGAGQTLHGWEFAWRQALDMLPGFLSNTGFTFNWTYSPSDTGKLDLAGNAIPFPDNSRNAGNLILWYQGQKLQVRLAGNYRSERAVSPTNLAKFELYQDEQFYLDASVAYNINDRWQVFLQGTNLTSRDQHYYYVWPDETAFDVQYEARYTLGVNFKF